MNEYRLVNIGIKVNIMLFLNDNCRTKTGIHKEIIQMLLELVTKLSTYGQFGRPLMNYLESTSLNDETKEYIEILKLYWDINYDEVIERIEKNISKLRKGRLYYVLLSIKLSVWHRLKRDEEVKDVYIELRDHFGEFPQYVRGLIVQSLRNIRELYYESNESMEKIRYWSEEYENNPVDKGFILMADAREKKHEEKFKKILVKRFMKDLNKIHLQEFIGNYINLDSKQKDIIEKYIMNYGRYYEIKNIPKELRPKVPKDINIFVKKYSLKRRLSATSFYVFEGKERKELVETLEAFV